MTINKNFVKTGAKAKIVNVLPSLNDAEDGELFYDVANTRLAMRTTEGWKYFNKD